jgi:hypothetical protein
LKSDTTLPAMSSASINLDFINEHGLEVNFRVALTMERGIYAASSTLFVSMVH